MESIQVYDGGEGLPPEIIAIIEENKKLRKQIQVLHDEIMTLKGKNSKLQNSYDNVTMKTIAAGVPDIGIPKNDLRGCYDGTCSSL
jgi:hypothetical protein